MKFDWSSCAVGVIAGIGTVLCISFAAQISIFVDTPICAQGEPAVACARNWANSLAILAGAATVFLLLREQKFAREVAILQTLDVRGRMVVALKVARALGIFSDDLRTSAMLWEHPRTRRTPAIVPTHMVRTLLSVEKLLNRETWTDFADADLELSDRRIHMLARIDDLVRTFLTDNLDFARNRPGDMTNQMITSEWTELVTPGEIRALSEELASFKSEVEKLTFHLLNFEGGEYWQRSGHSLPHR